MDTGVQNSRPPPHFLNSSWNSKHDSSMNQSASSSHDDPMPSTSDFVKKLYKMLEDPSFQNVVSWGPQGDCFVVKDMNEFTKSILPRMFKHSNFASFVRQLNKYDFHKVKNTDDSQFGEHSWTFRHPDFHADRRDALENIKRKVPAQRKAQQAAAAAAAAAAQAQAQAAALALPSLTSTSGTSLLAAAAAAAAAANNGGGSSSVTGGSSHTSSVTLQAQSQLQIDQLQLEVRRLKEEGDDLRGRIRALERNYESVLVEMVGFQRGMAQQDGLMQSLISYFLGNESGKLKTGGASNVLNPQSTPSASIVPSSSSLFPQLPSNSQQQQQQQQQQRLGQSQGSPQHQITGNNNNNRGSSSSRYTTPGGNTGRGVGYDTTTTTTTSTIPVSLPLGVSMSSMMPPPPSLASTSTSTAAAGTMDVGRASLMQMSEISRRANSWTPINNGGGGGGAMNWDGGESSSQTQQASSSSGQNRDGNGLFTTGSLVGMSRSEALLKIEEMYRMRMNSVSPVPVQNANSQWAPTATATSSQTQQTQQRQRQQQDGIPTSTSPTRAYNSPDSPTYPALPPPLPPPPPSPPSSSSQQRESQPRPPSASAFWDFTSSLMDDSESSRASLSHEGLQVYTVGHFMPRNRTDDLAAAAASSSSSSSILSGTTTTTDQWNFGPLPPFPAASTTTTRARGIRSGGGGDATEVEYEGDEEEGGGEEGEGENENEEEGVEEEEEEEERVMPSPVNAAFVGHTTLPSSSSSITSSSSSSLAAPVLSTRNDGSKRKSAAAAAAAAKALRSSSSSSNAKRKGRGNEVAVSSTTTATTATTATTGGSAIAIGKKKLRVRRSTFVPGWAVPPRVLLVDDDIVSRKLSSKFLQVYGCTIDVAVDGVSAVNKMNLEKYDLVLMDIVMPKLDGVSATSLIRQFDHMTPIISMTSNSKPNEIMTYYSSGMNDILPKPFTQNGLFEMLEKHLMHLKAIQRMNKVPRSIGIPPLSDSQFEQAVTAGAASLVASSSSSSSRLSSHSGLLPPPPPPPPTNSPSTSMSDIRSPQLDAVGSPTMTTGGGSGGSGSGSYSSFPGSSPGYSTTSSGGQMQVQMQMQILDDEGRINPLSGMGLTDEQYTLILQNIVNGESFMNGMDGSSNGGSGGSGNGGGNGGEKRGYEESGLGGPMSGRREKRSRFEVIE